MTLSKIDDLRQSEGIVFGRVNVVSGGEPQSWIRSRALGARAVYFDVFVLRDEESSAVAERLGDDNSFYWHLRPGNYMVVGFEWSEFGPIFRLRRGRIFARFVVPQTAPLVYIGTLVISVETFAAWEYSLRVEDDYERAPQDMRKRFPEIRGEPTRELMYLEQSR